MTEQILEKQIDHNDGIDLEAAFQESHIQEILDKLDQELVGLKSVKNKIREMAAEENGKIEKAIVRMWKGMTEEEKNEIIMR